MNEQIIDITHWDNKVAFCEEILRSLKEWFGIEEAIQNYLKEIRLLVTYAIKVEDTYIGFASIKEHNAYTFEIHVMGILKKYHNLGYGKLLLQEIELWGKQQGKVYMSVKTLDETRESREYDSTRHFYLAYGFVPIETFPTLWGEDNPCLLLIKKLE